MVQTVEGDGLPKKKPKCRRQKEQSLPETEVLAEEEREPRALRHSSQGGHAQQDQRKQNDQEKAGLKHAHYLYNLPGTIIIVTGR